MEENKSEETKEEKDPLDDLNISKSRLKKLKKMGAVIMAPDENGIVEGPKHSYIRSRRGDRRIT